MVILIATPSILVPGTSADTAQIVAFVSIFAAALTLFEYASSYPGLIEFRDAPPFNRIRFISLFLTVFLLSVMVRGETEPTTLTEIVSATGILIGQAIDFPYSPVRLILMMPETLSDEGADFLRTAAGLAYLISLVSLAVFFVVLRLMGWPSRTGAFNVWVNLPTFDPTAGGDVVSRLERDARINITLGFLLPFVTPMVVKAAAIIFFGAVSLENEQTLIWTVAAWAFLPASLFMRGIAMGRIAAMITEQRRRNEIAAQDAGLVHV